MKYLFETSLSAQNNKKKLLPVKMYVTRDAGHFLFGGTNEPRRGLHRVSCGSVAASFSVCVSVRACVKRVSRWVWRISFSPVLRKAIQIYVSI